MITASAELEKFLDRRAAAFAVAFRNLLDAYGVEGRWANAVFDLSLLIRATLILADLHGRKRILMEADHVRRKQASFDDIPETNPITPGLVFEEALEDLLAREPRLARSAEEVSRLYSTDRVFAAARSASRTLTVRVQKAVSDIIASGKHAARTENEIIEIAREEAHDWTRAYAATVYRTNVATAYTKGRFSQVRDPEVRDAVPAFEFVAILDDRTRPNHRAAHGLIAAVDDPIWRRVAPPLGYQCRCAPILVGRGDLARRGLLRDSGDVIRREPPGFSNAYPDPGFRHGEPDFFGGF